MSDRGKGSKRARNGAPRGGDPRVIQVNKRMALLGQQRQFSEVLKTFESLGHKGMQPSEVTYNVLLYACVRCGELQHAKTFLTQMLERNDLTPNVVTYTTVLKGLCVEGDMKAAEDLLGQMVVRRLKPNTRTINMYGLLSVLCLPPPVHPCPSLSSFSLCVSLSPLLLSISLFLSLSLEIELTRQATDWCTNESTKKKNPLSVTPVSQPTRRPEHKNCI